jgi:hypothetical protein
MRFLYFYGTKLLSHFCFICGDFWDYFGGRGFVFFMGDFKMIS